VEEVVVQDEEDEEDEYFSIFFGLWYQILSRSARCTNFHNCEYKISFAMR